MCVCMEGEWEVNLMEQTKHTNNKTRIVCETQIFRRHSNVSAVPWLMIKRTKIYEYEKTEYNGPRTTSEAFEMSQRQSAEARRSRSSLQVRKCAFR